MSDRMLRSVLLVMLAAAVLIGITGYIPAFSAQLSSESQEAYSKLSSAHRQLVRFLGFEPEAKLQLKLSNAPFTAQIGPKLVLPGKTKKVETVERVYQSPDSQSRALMAQSIVEQLRTKPVSLDGSDTALLDQLRELGMNTNVGKATLASTEDVQTTVDEMEPNDSYAEAQVLQYGDVVAAVSGYEEDRDVFAFEAAEGDYIKIKLDPSYEGYAVASVFDADSNLVSSGFYGVYCGTPVDAAPAEKISADVAICWPGGNVIGLEIEQAGTYYIEVTGYPGYIRYFLEDDANGTGDETRAGFKYTLSLNSYETYLVTGNVVDDNGRNVEKAEIYTWSNDGSGSNQIAHSQADGSFTIKLPEGGYGFTVSGPVNGPYPEQSLYSEAVIPLNGKVLQFELKTGVVFSGQVVNEDGAGVPDISFSLIDRTNGQYRWGYSDAEGNFSIAVFPGTFDIYVYSYDNYPRQPVIKGVSVKADTEYDIVLDSGDKLDGHVYAPDGSPVEGATLVFPGLGDYRRARTDAEGYYQISLIPGEYTIQVDVPDGYMVPDQYGGSVAVRGDVNYDVNLVPGGYLAGSVIDSRGNPVASSYISIYYVDSRIDPMPEIPDTMSREDYDEYLKNIESSYYDSKPPFYEGWTSFSVWTGEDGKWEIALLPGQYQVSVQVWNGYPEQSFKVGQYEVLENQTVDVGVTTVEYGLEFSGTLSKPNGAPLAYYSFAVETWYDDSPAKGDTILDDGRVIYEPDYYYNYYSYWFSTDIDGNFTGRLLPGKYNLSFYADYSEDGFPYQLVKGVEFNSDTRFDYTMNPGALVSGRVVDENGRGVEGNYVILYPTSGNSQSVSDYTDAKGDYSVRVSPGEYVVQVYTSEGYFMEEPNKTITVEKDTDLELAVVEGKRVHGRVTNEADGHPLSPVVVMFVPTDQSAWDSVYYLTPADADGGVRLSSVDVSSIPEPIKANYDDLNNNSKSGGNSDGSDVPAIDNEGVTPPADIYQPDSRFAPWPYWKSEFVATTDRDGNYKIKLSPGEYYVYAWYDSYPVEYASKVIENVVVEGEMELNIALAEQEIVLRGDVEGEDGGPADSVMISIVDPDTRTLAVALTDNAGAFEVALPKGSYDILADGSRKYGKVEAASSVELAASGNLTIRFGQGLLDNSASLVQGGELPKAFSLGQNSPNPFNPSTTISYQVSEPSNVEINVYDIRGAKVKSLVNEFTQSGSYKVHWDGSDSSGRKVSSGVYFYRMRAGSFEVIKKMVLLK